jgi:predicted dehydrogenase
VLIATPGFLHEEALLQIGERDLPILCEKPLTPDAASAWRIVQAEQRFGKKRIQVGFMRGTLGWRSHPELHRQVPERLRCRSADLGQCRQ